MRKLLRKLKLNICSLYVRLYIHRVLTGKTQSRGDFERFKYCLKQIAEEL